MVSLFRKPYLFLREDASVAVCQVFFIKAQTSLIFLEGVTNICFHEIFVN